ncbi:hypothetical protein JL101_032505 (plasmid) [Skermanella rosea]|uniref:hypothetical protein n=1 Tax=Skermanella rosea TaxID=1817965 RepID=UPI00193367FE|nr:hypothetical protein [Skermanella rosea]UEM07636.1 hypothetical protein JL101_032505 [Skermanella rosea]
MRRITLVLAGTLLGAPALAETITIGPGQSVTDAARRLAPGDTLLLAPGTYNESVDLSGLHGREGAPITIRAAAGPGTAVINGGRNTAAVQANRISHVAVRDLVVVANAGGTDDDVGGFKIWGSWDNPARHLEFTGNTITGRGQDGFKLFQGAHDVLVAGNTLDGDWRQEAIDNVSVRDTVYAGNTIVGRAGFSGLTLKAGSRDNVVRDNRIDVDAPTQLSVGGYGNSRLDREFPAEWQGFEARNTTVTGNAIDGSVRLVSAVDNRITGNAITGPVSSGTNVHMPNSVRSSGNTVDDGSRLERGVDGVGANIGDTGSNISGSVDRGAYRSQRRLEDLLSGDGITRQANRAIDGATGAVTGAIDRAIDETTDTVMQPVEDMIDGIGQTLSCNVAGAAVAGAAGIVSGIFSGGRATLGAQLAQHMTQIAGNLCLGKQLAAQRRQLEVQRRMLDLERRNIAAGTADNAAGLDGLMARTLPGLDRAGFLLSEPRIEDQYRQTYPDMFPPLPPDGLVEVEDGLRRHERDAHLRSLALQNRAVQEQAGTLGRAVDHAAAGRAGPGLRSELQAMNAIQGETIASINVLTAATVGHQRAVTEARLRDETRRTAANATAKEFMSTLAVCGNCNISRPFLGD